MSVSRLREAITRLPDIADTLIYRRWPQGKGIYAEDETPELDDGQFLRELARTIESLLHEREEMREALDISLKAIELMQAVGLPEGDRFAPDSLPGRAMSAARNAFREGGRPL